MGFFNMKVIVKYKKSIFDDTVEFQNTIEMLSLKDILKEFLRLNLSHVLNFRKKICIWVNNKSISIESWSKLILEDGDEVVIVPKLEGEAIILAFYPAGYSLTTAGVIAATAINAIILAGISGLLQMLFAPTVSSGSTDPTYGWGGIQNTSTAGIAVPVIYGKHLTGGNIISVDTLYQTVYQAQILPVILNEEAQKNFLEMVIGLSEGMIEGLGYKNDLGVWKFNNFPDDFVDVIEDGKPSGGTLSSWSLDLPNVPYIKINDQFIDNFSDVSYTVSSGGESPYPVIGMSKVKNYYPQTAAALGLPTEDANKGAISYTTISDDVEGVKLHFVCQNGLIRHRSTGDSDHQDAVLEIRYKTPGESTYRAINPLNSTITVSGKSTSPVYFTVHLDTLLTPSGSNKSKWEIRMWQIDLAASSKKAINDVSFVGATEYQAATLSYPNTAVLYIKALATERLSGSLPKITSMVYGKRIRVPHLQTVHNGNTVTLPYSLCFYDTESEEYKWSLDLSKTVTVSRKKWITQYSNNPVWCYADLCLNRRFGLGEYLHPNDLMIDEDFDDGGNEWFENAKLCDSLVQASSTRTEKGTIKIHTLSSWILSVIKDDDYTFKKNDIGKFIVTTNSNDEETMSRIFYTFDVVTPKFLEKKFKNTLDLTNIRDEELMKYAITVGGWTNGNPRTVNKVTYWLEEKAFELDMVINDREEALDQLARLAITFRGIPLYTEGTIRLKIDQAEDPIHLLTMGNIIKGSFSKTFASAKAITNTLEAEFCNRDEEFTRDTRTMFLDLAIDAGDEEKKQSVDFRGITRESQLAREMSYILKCSYHRKGTVNFKAGIDSLHALAGENINLQHDTLLEETGGRIKAYTISPMTVTIDKEVTIEAGKTYYIYWTFPGASSYTIKKYAVLNSPGTYTDILVDNIPSGDIPEEERPTEWETIYTFGEFLAGVKKYRLVKAAQTDKDEIEISAIEDSDEVYTSEILPFGTNSTPNLPVNPHKLTANVEDLTLGTIIGGRGSFGISVSWRMPEGEVIEQLEIFLARSNAEDQRNFWIHVGTTSSVSFEIWEGIILGLYYEVKVVSVSQGRAKSEGVNESIRIVTDPPDAVEGLHIIGHPDETEFDGKNCLFGWKRRSRTRGSGNWKEREDRRGWTFSDPDKYFKEYEIRIQTETPGATHMTEVIQETTEKNRFLYTFEKNKEDFGTVQATFTFVIAAVDVWGQKSDPVSFEVSNSVPLPPEGLEVTYAIFANRIKWTPLVLPDGIDYESVEILRRVTLSPPSGSYDILGTVHPRNHRYRDRDATEDVEYDYTIRITDVYGQKSPTSDPSTETKTKIIPSFNLPGRVFGIEKVEGYATFATWNCYHDGTNWRFGEYSGYAFAMGKGNWDEFRIYKSSTPNPTTPPQEGTIIADEDWIKISGWGYEKPEAPDSVAIDPTHKMRFLPGGAVRVNVKVTTTVTDDDENIKTCDLRYVEKP